MTDNERPRFEDLKLERENGLHIQLRDDYLLISKRILDNRVQPTTKNHANADCMARIIAKMVRLTRYKHSANQSHWITMSTPQWLHELRWGHGENAIKDSVLALVDAGLFAREQDRSRPGKPTYRYLLQAELLQELVAGLPANILEALEHELGEDTKGKAKRGAQTVINKDLSSNEVESQTLINKNSNRYKSEFNKTQTLINNGSIFINNDPTVINKAFLYNRESEKENTDIKQIVYEAPASPLRTHLSEENEILLSHPVHKFILFDSLTHPTKAVAFGLTEPVPYDVDGTFNTEKENDRRKRVVEDVVRRLTAKGYPITVKDITWKYIKAEDENVVESNLPSYSQSLPEETLSSQETGGVGNQEGKYAAGYPGVAAQKEPETEKPAKETPERKAAREIVEYTEANRYVAGRRGGPFTREPRGKGKSGMSQWDKNFDAALKIVKVGITPEQYIGAYDHQNNDWWNNTVGSLTCVEMAANTKNKEMRAIELWNKVSSKSVSIAQSARLSATGIPRTNMTTVNSAPPAPQNTEQEMKDLAERINQDREEYEIEASPLQNEDGWQVFIKWASKYLIDRERAISVGNWQEWRDARELNILQINRRKRKEQREMQEQGVNYGITY